MLKNNNVYNKAQKNIVVYAGTVNQLLIYMAMKQADVAIIWEDMLTWSKEKGKLEIIQIPKNENIIKTIPASVSSKCKNKKMAVFFKDYLTSEKSKQIWEKWGFKL
jgi:molybdate transport system substrate-binding protein